MDALVAIDTLDDLIHNAPKAFFSGDVRLDPGDVAETLDHLRAGLTAELPEARRSASWQLLEDLETCVRKARPVRGRRRIRVDADALYELLDRLRATVPEDIKRATDR